LIGRGSLQEKNGIYQAVFYIKGRKNAIWRSTGIKVQRGNKRKAEQRMKEIISEFDDNPNMFDKINFVTYIDKWLKTVKNQVDKITYEGYKSYADKHIKPYFKPLKLNLQDVKMSDIEKYYQYKSVSGRLDGKEGGLSYRSIQLHNVVLNMVFNEAIRQSIIKENPCRYAKIPKTAKRSDKKIEFYTPEQCTTLLEVTTGTILYDMIYITFMYGLRRSELMGLKWSAVDFDNNTLAICHTVVLQNVVVEKDTTKNQSSNRIYPLLDDVKEILLRRKRQQEEHKKLFGNCYNNTGYVFVKEDGSQYYPSYPSHELQKQLQKNNLPHIRWHDLRHSCASMLILKGWSMKDISDWLGHADIGTTMNIYGHLSMKHKRTLGNSLNGLLN
jgi:integrase